MHPLLQDLHMSLLMVGRGWREEGLTHARCRTGHPRARFTTFCCSCRGARAGKRRGACALSAGTMPKLASPAFFLFLSLLSSQLNSHQWASSTRRRHGVTGVVSSSSSRVKAQRSSTMSCLDVMYPAYGRYAPTAPAFINSLQVQWIKNV